MTYRNEYSNENVRHQPTHSVIFSCVKMKKNSVKLILIQFGMNLCYLMSFEGIIMMMTTQFSSNDNVLWLGSDFITENWM